MHHLLNPHISLAGSLAGFVARYPRPGFHALCPQTHHTHPHTRQPHRLWHWTREQLFSGRGDRLIINSHIYIALPLAVYVGRHLYWPQTSYNYNASIKACSHTHRAQAAVVYWQPWFLMIGFLQYGNLS